MTGTNMKQGVIWTRVSTEEQEKNNGSLDNQLKACIDYAQRSNIKIVDYYGGTHESAKEEGEKFKEMLAAVEASPIINCIIVYSTDRFTRNAVQALPTIKNLCSKNIIVISASQGISMPRKRPDSRLKNTFFAPSIYRLSQVTPRPKRITSTTTINAIQMVVEQIVMRRICTRSTPVF